MLTGAISAMADRLQFQRQVRRQWQLVALLRSCGWRSLAELAAGTGVTTRTTRRDLAVLEELHLPIVDAVDEHSGERYWRWLRGAACPCCGRSPRMHP